MSAWKEALLREAARRFEEQQAKVLASAAASSASAVLPSTKIMAPISPSPPALIEEVLRRLAGEQVHAAPSGGSSSSSSGGSGGSGESAADSGSSKMEDGPSASSSSSSSSSFSSDATAATPLVGPGACIVDLGCGDGRWLLAAARAFRDLGVQCVGYDLDEILLEKARRGAAAFELEMAEEGAEAEGSEGGGAEATAKAASSVAVHRQDLMLADVSGATVVVAYLFREGCVEVQEKLDKELPPRAAVVSVGFAMRGWDALWSCRVEGSVPCYYYSRPWQRTPVQDAGR